ncbi:hypothetical protein H721_02779 [Brucella ovis IntaBari-2006-46-332]|nr:hypothetical protein C010_02946 [Brucella ovis 80/125]ENR05942.1 hypothetical protein C961_02647 [Brucella ovis F8/05B]ENS92327.1 hypothetical protein B999_02914 [Brucella ovis 63/96]ENS95838.1 hypothetical protein C009_02794 [Brucella ovis 81/8]ENT75620.1 hypothetical protein H712_02923 [Brucella ovis IntaBari-2009-88-4]ENT77621.1 hypothetical protein H720_02709 [Brucella ovis IntaBari-2006-46-348]ENT81071.1 hypothetical protein H713_02930 [Brucella ovis IntaBari-2010-47-268]ENT85663.1 h
MDRIGAGEQLHGLFQRLRFDRFQKSLKRGAPGLGKFGQKCWRSTCRCFTQMQEAGGIIRPAARIGFAKKALHFRKNRKTQNLAKAHESRTLHARTFGHFRHGGNRDAILIGGDIIGALLQALGQAVGNLQQSRLEFFYARRGRRWRRGGIHRYPFKTLS